MADPKGISFGAGNLGLATPITGMARPAMGVYAKQQQEEKLRKAKEAEARNEAVDADNEWSSGLLDKELETLNTRLNDYKYGQLNTLKDSFAAIHQQYSAKGQSIPLDIKRQMEKDADAFYKNYEQATIAENYDNGIIKTAEKDPRWNLKGTKEVLSSVPEGEDGDIAWSNYTEKERDALIKKNALKVLNAPVVAQEFSKTMAEQVYQSEISLGNGQTKQTLVEGRGLKVFIGPDGKKTNKNPDTGFYEMDTDSPDALYLARKDEHMNMLIEAMVSEGEAGTPAEAYKKIMSLQQGGTYKQSIQGSIKSDDNGTGSAVTTEDYNFTDKLVRNIQHAFGADGKQGDVSEEAHKSASTLVGGKIGDLHIIGYDFEKGGVQFDKEGKEKKRTNNSLILKVSSGKSNGQVFTDEIKIDLSNPGSYEQIFSSYQSTRSNKKKVDFQNQIKYNEEQKKKSGLFQPDSKPNSGISW
jgi:hypothetical protein